jgi:chromosome segregation ATPase
MDKQELFNQVKSAVDVIFAEKEDADKQAKAEQALRKSATTINDLTNELENVKAELESVQEKENTLSASLDDKEKSNETLTQEVEDLKSSLSEKEEALATATKELEDLKKAKEELDTESASIKEELENLKKDMLSEARLKELETAEVIAKDKEKQLSKIRDLTDEEFASYKEDLVSIRESIIASIKKDDNNAPTGDNSDDNVKTYANVSGGNPGSLDLESKFKDMYKEYSTLGEAMAERMSKKEE